MKKQIAYATLFATCAGFSGCGGNGSSDNATGAGTASPVNGTPTETTTPNSRFALASGCFLFGPREDGRRVAKNTGGEYLATEDAASAQRFFMQATGLGTYLFYDEDGQFLAVQSGLVGGESIGSDEEASDAAEWTFAFQPGQEYSITSTAEGQHLAVDPASGALTLAATNPGSAGQFRFEPATTCADFPEAELGATGTPFSGTNDDGTVFGIADAHTHISAHQRLGGRAIYGEPFHRFGITHALHDCEIDHGPNGSVDVFGNFVRSGNPAGTHQTLGWPSFPEWPSFNTYTHQQTYYIWVKRAWMAGLRLLVNHTSGDEQLCVLLPLKDPGANCDEMDQVRRQIQGMRALQDYIDAQNGGPGEGWFRIVEDSATARRVIEQGKLAVILGIEASKLFSCGEFLDSPECNREDIDAGIDEFFGLGVRSVFVNHWFDNAFGGAGLFDQSELTLNVLNKPETGHYYRVEACPEPNMGANLQSLGTHIEGDGPIAQAINELQSGAVPTYGPGPHCNAKPLTDLGAYIIESLADRGMIIETDHLGAKMKNQVLDIVEARDYPVVAGHFHAGGISSETQLRRILGVGGIAAPIKPDPDEYPEKVALLERLRSDSHYFGVPLSSDSGGIATLPGPPSGDEALVEYPFTSFDGNVTFTRQITGERSFDFNEDGVAHYGLFADWFNAVGRSPDGEAALEQLFRSAEAYLRMWELAESSTGR